LQNLSKHTIRDAQRDPSQVTDCFVLGEQGLDLLQAGVVLRHVLLGRQQSHLNKAAAATYLPPINALDEGEAHLLLGLSENVHGPQQRDESSGLAQRIHLLVIPLLLVRLH